MHIKPKMRIGGDPFDPETVKAVWNKGLPIPEYDETIWRQDHFGNIIRFNDYADEKSAFGWHIDHIKPVSLAGYDGLQNLEPLYWKTNIIKSERFPFDSRALGQGW
jgi:hypothetical protein